MIKKGWFLFLLLRCLKIFFYHLSFGNLGFFPLFLARNELHINLINIHRFLSLYVSNYSGWHSFKETHGHNRTRRHTHLFLYPPLFFFFFLTFTVTPNILVFICPKWQKQMATTRRSLFVPNLVSILCFSLPTCWSSLNTSLFSISAGFKRHDCLF